MLLERIQRLIMRLATPSKNRVVNNLPLFLTAVLHLRTIPQVIMILDYHFEGKPLFNTRFDGASSTVYGI